MRGRIVFLLLAALLLTGCAGLFEREYSYSAPFTGSIRPVGADATEVSNYNMLKSALIDLVNHHEKDAAFRFSRYNGSVADDLAAACLEVRTENPLGAYAVETMTYDTSRIVSYYTADVEITYKKTAEEIRKIVGVGGVPELREKLWNVVTEFEEETVLRVYSAQVDEAYIASLIEEFHLDDPVTVVTAPEAEIESYPGEGINRIYDIRLRYGASAERLQEMSGALAGQVAELAEGLRAEADTAARPRLSLDCAALLYERLNGEPGSYRSTAYGALAERSADSKGVALAYKALCDALGIECLVVKGNIGDIRGQEHYWNILGLEGAYYHADVSAFGGDRSHAFLLDDAGLWGTYLWDTEAYPACRGGLRYADVAPEDQQPEEPLPERKPEEEPEAEPENRPAPPQETEEPPAPTTPPETEPPQPSAPPPPPPATEPPAPTPPPQETEEPEETETPDGPGKNMENDEILS